MALRTTTPYSIANGTTTTSFPINTAVPDIPARTTTPWQASGGAPPVTNTNGSNNQIISDPLVPSNPATTDNNYYNVNTGQAIGQFYGRQNGPGNIVFGSQPGSGGTSGGTTTPGTPGTGTTFAPGVTYGADGKPDMGAMYLAAHPQATGAWDPGASLSGNQAWQNFSFSNPTENWQKNFNSLSGIDKFRYGFDPQGGGQQAMIAAMTQAGIDPNTIRHLASMFGGGTGNYGQELGITGNAYQGNIRQIGNQLWGTGADGQRYLIKDFGNNGTMNNATGGNWFQNTGDSYLQGGSNNPGASTWGGPATYAQKPPTGTVGPGGPDLGPNPYGGASGAPGYTPGAVTPPPTTTTPGGPNPGTSPGVTPGGSAPGATKPKNNIWGYRGGNAGTYQLNTKSPWAVAGKYA